MQDAGPPVRGRGPVFTYEGGDTRKILTAWAPSPSTHEREAVTTQREAKKQRGKAGSTVAVQSWEEKLRAAIMTGREGIILAQLTAWAALDPHSLLKPVGEERTFTFNPAAVARQKRLQLMADGDWPLYKGGS